MRRNILICLLLTSVTLAVYWPVGHLGFMPFDDCGRDGYVVGNPNVEAGITLGGIEWAFTTTHASNWHPLTWFSHMLDCQLFGVKPSGHHWVNLGIHILNTLLLFLVLRKMTRMVWRSALVAALFAWHPLHIQSVAWVSERKDLLSGFFMMLTLWAWVKYAQGAVNREPGGKTSNISASGETSPKPRLRRGGQHPTSNAQWCYWSAVFFFALGLMSKPMLVTLPVILLLLDFWPLQRMSRGERRGTRAAEVLTLGSQVSTLNPALLIEKAPFAALSLASCIVTVWAQNKGGAVAPLDNVPWESRIENVIVSYITYLGKMFWPENLAIFYSFTYTQTNLWEVSACSLLLVLLSVFFIRRAFIQPFMFVGWVWFLVMLLPVIGFIQITIQSIADRYTYLPSIGLFMIMAWGIAEVASLSRLWRTAAIIGMTSILSACLLETRHQLGYWQNSLTLFSRALEITGDTPAGRYNLGNAYWAAGDLDAAAKNLLLVIRSGNNLAEVHYRLGLIYLLQKKWPEAEIQFDEYLRLDPDNPFIRKYLGDALSAQKKFMDAENEYATASQLRPNDPVIQQALEKNRCLEVLHLKPDVPEVLNNLAWMLATSTQADIRDGPRAVQLAERACDITGGKKTIFLGTLAAAYAEAGRFDDAISAAQKACDLARQSGEHELLKKNQELLELYRKHQPYRE